MTTAEFSSATGIFPVSEITPAMVRALDSADDHGRIRCSTQVYNRLARLGLARHEGLCDHITEAGWNALALFPLSAEHKTRTFLLSNEMDMRYKPNGRDRVILVSQVSKAVCTCGWSVCGDTREGARALAAQHRRTQPQEPRRAPNPL